MADGSERQIRLLVVDDDRLILATMTDGLRRLGYGVTAAASAKEALNALAETEFDLAILDVRMPDMGGLELSRRLRADRAVPVMFLSAYNDLETARQAAQNGAITYIVKPADVPQLVPSIEAALARGSELNALRASESRLSDALGMEQKTRMAVGVLMERKQLDRQEAFEALRGYARSHRRKVSEVAGELLDSVESLNLQLKPPSDKAEIDKGEA